MVELSTHQGYHGVSITELCSHAGVSPVTFYQQFGSKEACFLAAYVACGEQIFAGMRSLSTESPGLWQGARAALEALLSGLRSDPEAGRLLFIEALGAGPAIQVERERVLVEFERGAQELMARSPGDAYAIDVPLLAVIGALRHVISRRLRTHAADELPALLEDGLSWLHSYAVPAGAPAWSTSPGALLRGTRRPPAEVREAEPLRPGTHGLPADMVARNQRMRLINATAQVMMAKGYQETKITDVVAAARVAKPVFHAHFSSKEHAFLEAQEYPTQYILDSCAEAYFSADEWPTRMWRMLAKLLSLIVVNPTVSHLRLVECYAAGREAIRRAEQVTRSFTIFLHEGYRYRREAASLPRLYSQAIAGATFEIVQRLVAYGDWDEIPRRLPQLTYIAIAPFTGAREAVSMVEELKARDGESRAPLSRQRKRHAASR